MATILVEILGSSKQFKSELDGAVASTEKANSSFTKMSKVAGVAGLALTAGLVVGLAKSVDAAQEFQGSMELIQTQAGASSREVHNMSKALLGMAASVGSTPEELSKGLYHVESAGFRGAKALSILRLAAEGAAVGHSDLESTTSALVAAQRSGIKGLGDMSHAMGSLNAIVGAGNMRMEDLTSALGTGILPSAKAFGLSIADVGGALATLTSNGIPAVNAASGLKMMFASLAAPTAKAAKELKSIGLSSTDLAETMRHKGLNAALMELKQHLTDSGMNATQTAALLATAFGKKSSTGLLTLLGNLKDMKAAQDQVISGASSFGANWEQTQRTSEFATRKFHAALSALEVEVGAALLPTLVRVTNALTGFIQFLSTSPGVAHAAATALQVFKDVMVVVIGVGQRLLTWMQQNQTATKAIVAGLAVLAIAFAGPVVAIVALGVALIELYKHSQQFRNIVNAAMEDVKQKFNDVFPTIKTIVTQSITAAVTVAEAAWKRFGGALTSIAKIALQTIANEFRDFGNVIKGVVNLIGDLIHGRWSKIWGDLETIVKGVFAGIEDLVTGEAKIMFIEAKAIGSAIVDGVVAGMGDLVSAVGSKLSSGLHGALGAARGVLRIHSPSGVAADEIGKPIGEGVIQGWLESTATLPAKMSQGLQNAITAGRAVIQAAQSSFKTAWSSLASDADTAFQKISSSALTKTEKIIAAIQAGGQKAQRASDLLKAKNQLYAAQAGPNQTDAEKALAALQSTHDETARNQALSTAQDQLATAQAGGDPAAILSAQQQVADAQYNIQVASLQKQIDAESAKSAQVTAIKDAQTAVETATQAISDAARDEQQKKQAEKERLNLDARTALQQRHFDKALEKLQTHLAKGHTSYEEAQKAILKLFKSFGVDYKAAGADLGTAFITGLKELIHDAATKSGDLAPKLESVAAGIHIPHAATGGFVSQTGLAVIHQGETITPAGQGGGVTVIVNGWVGNDQDIAEKIRNALIRTGRSTTGGALGGFA